MPRKEKTIFVAGSKEHFRVPSSPQSPTNVNIGKKKLAKAKRLSTQQTMIARERVKLDALDAWVVQEDEKKRDGGKRLFNGGGDGGGGGGGSGGGGTSTPKKRKKFKPEAQSPDLPSGGGSGLRSSHSIVIKDSPTMRSGPGSSSASGSMTYVA